MISLQVYEDINAAEFVATITDQARDTWQRTAQGFMGDDQATCTIEDAPGDLRDMFDGWLGYWVIETESGLPELPAFTGQIFTMRLFLNGRIYVVTLADVFNQAIVAYTTTAGGATSYATATSSASVAIYGTRALLVTLDAPTTTTTASNKASDMVSELGTPRPRLVGFYDPAQGNRLEMTILGSGHLLEVTMLHAPSAVGNNYLGVEVERVAAAIGGRFDTGSISANTRGQLVAAVTYTSLWDRLGDVLAAGAPSWRLGCFGTPALDYYQLDEASPRYRLEFTQWGRVFYDNVLHCEAPESLVRPGQYAALPDVEIDLPTTILIDGLTYTPAGGLQFSPELEDRLAAIAFRLGVQV